MNSIPISLTFISQLGLLLSIIVFGGCRSLKPAQPEEFVTLPKVEISGEYVNDQLIDIPKEGVTVGEALGKTLRPNVDDDDGRGRITASKLFAVVDKGNQKLYIPVPLARDFVAGKIQLEIGDKIQIASGENTIFGDVASQTGNMRTVITSGLVSNPGPKQTSKTFADFIDQDVKNKGQLEKAATIIQIKRIRDNVIHRLFLPLKKVEISGLNLELILINSGLFDSGFENGDVIEVTRLTFVPEIIRGSAVASSTLR